MEPVPADRGWKVEYTLDSLPVYRSANRETENIQIRKTQREPIQSQGEPANPTQQSPDCKAYYSIYSDTTVM